MVIIAFGNAFEGLELVGPFASSDDALAYIEATNSQNYEIVKLDPPDSDYL